MNKTLFTTVLILVALIGCGGEPSEPTPPSESTPAVDKPTSAEGAVVAQDDGEDLIVEEIAEPFELAAASQDEIEAADSGDRLSDVAPSEEVVEPPAPAEDITSTGSAKQSSQFKFLTVDEADEASIPGFEWVDEASAAKKEADMKARAEAEKQAGIEAAANEDALREELDAVRLQQEQELAELKAAQEQAERDRMVAEAAAEEARMQAEADALARKEAQEELARLKADAEKARMAAEAEAEAARKQAEAEALAKKEAEEELKRIQAETEQQRMAAQAEAEEARKQAEADALAKKQAQEELARVQAEAEEALLKAREEKEMAVAEAAEEAVEGEAAETAPAVEPIGTIQLAKLDLDAQENGANGVGLGSEANVENLNGAKIELAAYFFDKDGKPLQDSDRVNRSSRGQVYVGKESIVPSNDYALSDTLFIPFEQLELAAGQEHEVQVELVLWEYSQGRGRQLATSPKATFRHAPKAAEQVVQHAAVRHDISGTWRHDEGTFTIVQQGSVVALNGLGIVPYNVQSEEWTYEDGKLQGTVVSKRNFPPLTRVWTFDLSVSSDGNTLSGTFHRADKKGGFAFTSEPFTWTRVD